VWLELLPAAARTKDGRGMEVVLVRSQARSVLQHALTPLNITFDTTTNTICSRRSHSNKHTRNKKSQRFNRCEMCVGVFVFVALVKDTLANEYKKMNSSGDLLLLSFSITRNLL